MKRYARMGFAICILLFAVLGAWALDAFLDSTDITVVLRADGKADIYYSLEWSASGGQMHGFYFQGEAFNPVWNPQGCFAEINGGKRVPLSIRDLGFGKYDIVLANGEGFSGRAFYHLNYAGDFAAAGLIGSTTSSELGELVYFDWAPVEWDQRLQSRTLRLVLPVTVGGGTLTATEREAVPLKTETWVNEENKMDFYGSPGSDGAFYLTLRFFQQNPGAGASQRIALYFPAGYLPLTAALSRNGGPGAAGFDGTDSPDDSENDFWLTTPLALAIGAVLIVLAMALYYANLRRYGARAALVRQIAWAGDSWLPPKLFAGSYQVPGKIAKDLHPAEVALLFELPLARVVALMVEGLQAKGMVNLLGEEPLRISITSAKPGEGLEEAFLACFDSEGRALSGLLTDFFEGLIKDLQEKLWDCDMEATKTYYRQLLSEAERMEAEADIRDEEAEARRASWRAAHPHWLYWHSYCYLHAHPVRYGRMGLHEAFSANYGEFMRSASCFSGCFSPTGGAAGTCVSACHNACHDACHSECHSACHSACQSACHSACVSGGAH